jgi:hypothetical protein
MIALSGHRLATVAILFALVVAYLGARPAGAEQSGGDGVVVSLDGGITPRYIPRHRPAPIFLRLSGNVRADEGAPPPQLRWMEIAFGARGGLEADGLPICRRSLLRDSTPRQALARCPGALVGRGTITTEVPFDPAKPVIARARVLAFNGRSGGRPAVWIHAYSGSLPVSFVLPFYIRMVSSGAYGVLMRAPVRRALGRWPRLRSFDVTLGRRYRAAGGLRSYLTAHCPLPPRFSVGLFAMARATYRFASGPTLTTTIQRGCRVRR